MLNRVQAARWVSRVTEHPVRESTLRSWACAGLLPDEGRRGIAAEYGPAELFVAAVVSSLRKNHLRLAEFREALRIVYRLWRGLGPETLSRTGAHLLVGTRGAVPHFPSAHIDHQAARITTQLLLDGPVLLVHVEPIAKAALSVTVGATKAVESVAVIEGFAPFVPEGPSPQLN